MYPFPRSIILQILMEKRPKDEIDLVLKILQVQNRNWHKQLINIRDKINTMTKMNFINNLEDLISNFIFIK